MYPRLVLMRELLSERGSIYVHIDWHIGAYIKALLDDIFGKDNFRNEIIWHYQTYQGQVKAYFPRKHDNIFLYSKSKNPTFHLLKDDNLKELLTLQDGMNISIRKMKLRVRIIRRQIQDLRVTTTDL